MTTSIAIILPALDEAITIAGAVAAFHAALPEAALYVIDNGSADGTSELARQALAATGAAGGVLCEPRRGKANALRHAFDVVEAEAYLVVDADLTYPADRARDLLQPILDGSADMVVGDRHTNGNYGRQNRRRFHAFGNELVRVLINRFFGASLCDVMSGYRALSRRFVKNYPILVEGFEVETDMTMHALDKRYRITEIAVDYIERPAGSESKLSTFSDGARVVFTIAQILRYYRPLAFFGALALVALLLGLCAGAPVLDDWITHRYIYRVPLAILAAALEIVAVVTLSIGLVLDGIARQQRASYELHLLAQGRSHRDG